MAFSRTAIAILTSTSLVLAGGLTACSSGQGIGGADAGAARDEEKRLPMDGSEVIQDPDGTGAEVSQRFFDTAETVVVSAPDRDTQMQAAAVAISVSYTHLTLPTILLV